MTPPEPIGPINKPTTAGPANAGKPAPRFNIAIEAPLKYEKWSVCGKLVYEDRIEQLNIKEEPELYCSDWCIEWKKKREKIKAGTVTLTK